MNPIKPKETQPSELAMKAAVDIVWSGNQGYPINNPTDIAKIIDHKLNLTTLLKQRDALREAVKKLVKEWEDESVSVSTILEVQSALALCKEAK